MDVLIVFAALLFLTVVAYRGFNVILFAPVAALLAVLLTSPKLVLPFYSGVFMERTAGFVKLYFPIFLLGAVFGKLMEVSGFARSIVQLLSSSVRPAHAMLSIVLVCAILTYGGVSLFVVAFAVYPFAAELFRTAGIPKRLIPATIALGAFTFTMDALPGSPQIQNLIPTTFFKTDAWAAPWLGTAGAFLLFVSGMSYLEWRRRRALHANETYGEFHLNEPLTAEMISLPHPAIAALPLITVGVLNKVLTETIPALYGTRVELAGSGAIEVPAVAALWSVEGALLAAILLIVATAWARVRSSFQVATGSAVGGALLACLNTASEYGFGAVIALLSGFRSVNEFLTRSIADPLLNIAVTTNVLAGITGSASGGLSIVLGSMAQSYVERAQAAGIPLEVVHRIAAMASGGMDTLPHNGAIITLLAVTGLTHRQSYPDIFAITLIKLAIPFFAIGLYRAFGLQ